MSMSRGSTIRATGCNFRRSAPPRIARGFTLVEALVAIAILALVALLAWRATASMTDSEVRVAAERARWQRLDAVLSRIEADLRESVPRAARHGAGTDAAWSLAPSDSAGNALLVFTRAGPSAIDEPGNAGQRVGYRFRNRQIEVLYWPHIDNVAADDAMSYGLTDDVASFHVAALTADNRWSDRWPLPGSAPIPRGVRVDLQLADGTVVERLLVLQ
jgi:general secretion pathway protein J